MPDIKIDDKVIITTPLYRGKTGTVVDIDTDFLPDDYPITVHINEDEYEMAFRESELEVTA